MWYVSYDLYECSSVLSVLRGDMVVKIDFFHNHIMILHLCSLERPYIVSFKKYNGESFRMPIAMETIRDGRQTTFLKFPIPPKIMHL